MRVLLEHPADWLLSQEAHNIYSNCMYDKTYDAYQKKMVNYIKHPQTKCFYCVDEGEKVGIVVFEISNDGTEILGIAVHPSYRSQGIGSFMVKEALDVLHPKKLIVKTDDDAIDFYLKNGFCITKKDIQAYPDGEVFRYTCVLDG